MEIVNKQVLRFGRRLRAFSQGGMRIVRIEGTGELKSCGEGRNIGAALHHAVIGELFSILGPPFYFYEDNAPLAELDQWLLEGSAEFWMEGEDIVVELYRHARFKIPSDIKERLAAADDGKVEWRERGYTYITRVATVDGAGTPMPYTDLFSTPCVHILVHSRDDRNPPRGQPFYFPIRKTGRGKDFATALSVALAADEVELTD